MTMQKGFGIMRPAIQEVMKATGCEKWPERWNGLYDSLMEQYEKYGCELADPSFYDKLDDKYDGMLEELTDDYKNAAIAIGEDDSFCRLLVIVAAALRDRENIYADLKHFTPPKTADRSRSIKHDMFPAIATCAVADYTYGLLTARGLPKEQVQYGMRCHNGMIRTFKARNNGAPGAMSWVWYQLAVDARLYGIGRLQMEVFAKFYSKAVVFENGAGENIALACKHKLHRDGMSLGSKYYEDEEGSWVAELEENESEYIGYPYDERGFVKKEKITLKKSEWKKILEPGDDVLGVHIPPGGGLSAELVDESFEATKQFLADYFPDFDYKGFVCESWLMDRQLVEMTGEGSNIAKFCKRFTPCCVKSNAGGVFNFVFMKYDLCDVVYEELSENTSLERKLKEKYLSGGAIYETYGYIPKNKL